jgi:hypothetical protein
MISISIIVYDDLLYNADMGMDRAITCHGNGDLALSVQGDIQLTGSGIQAILQRIFLWMSIKEGEVPGDPDLGCCVYRYFYKKATPGNFALLQREIQYQLSRFIPELQVQSVVCNSSVNNYGTIDAVNIIILSKDYGKIDLKATKGDVDALNESLDAIDDALEFIKVNNQ